MDGRRMSIAGPRLTAMMAAQQAKRAASAPARPLEKRAPASSLAAQIESAIAAEERATRAKLAAAAKRRAELAAAPAKPVEVELTDGELMFLRTYGRATRRSDALVIAAGVKRGVVRSSAAQSLVDRHGITPWQRRRPW